MIDKFLRKTRASAAAVYCRVRQVVGREGLLYTLRRASYVLPRSLPWRRRRAKQHQERRTGEFSELIAEATKANKLGTDGMSTIESPNWKHGVHYEAVPEEAFVRLMSAIPIDTNGFWFIDLGSGKGRALLLAALHPFSKIVGVEYSRELHDQAVRNVERFVLNDVRHRAIVPVCGDVMEYEFPEERSVVFMNNPFDHYMMRIVLERLVASVQKCPRDVFIVYYHGICSDVFSEGCFDKIYDGRSLGNGLNFIFRVRTARDG